ncbi:MAG: hypothetical protein WD042_02540 [Phycisphaeraceae bacterium]
MRNTRKKTALDFHGFPKDWAGLTGMLPLRPIHDKVELDNATEVIDAMAGHDLSRDQDDYLEALSTLVMAYEDEHQPIDVKRMTPVEVLRYLVEQSGMTASALGELLGNRSLGSKLLRGERELSKAHIRVLADHYRVSTDLFIG